MRQFQSPPLSKINKIIIFTSVGLFVLSQILASSGSSLVPVLGLSVSKLFSGHVYQLFTFPFIERSFMAVLFNGLVVWFIGSELEKTWGEKLYLQFLAACTLATAVLYILIVTVFYNNPISMGFPIIGLNALCYGMLGAYAIIFSDRELTFMFLFPMKAKYFCLLLGGIQLYSAFTSPYAKSAWAHLAGLVFGVGFLRIKAYLTVRSRNLLKSNKDAKRKKSGLYIVKDNEKPGEGDDDDKPKYFH
jgi:membrane associated rhomboid family serine protease